MITYDKKKCIGCQCCTSTCPENFKSGKDGKIIVVNADKPSKNAKEAVENCPVMALKL